MPNFEDKKQIFYQLKELISTGVDYKEILRLFKVPTHKISDLEKMSFARLFAKELKLNKFDLYILEVFDHAGKLETGLSILIEHYKNLVEQSKNFLSLMIRPMLLCLLALLIMPLPQVVQGHLNIYEYLLITYIPIFLGYLFYRKLRKSILRGRLLDEFTFLSNFSIAENIYRNLYFSALSQLIEAGIAVSSAIDLADAFAKTKKLQIISYKLKDNLYKESLLESLMSTSLEAEPLQWINTYEKNGRFDIGFHRISEWYEDKAINDLRALVKWLPKIFYFIVVASIAYGLINR